MNAEVEGSELMNFLNSSYMWKKNNNNCVIPIQKDCDYNLTLTEARQSSKNRTKNFKKSRSW